MKNFLIKSGKIFLIVLLISLIILFAAVFVYYMLNAQFIVQILPNGAEADGFGRALYRAPFFVNHWAGWIPFFIDTIIYWILIGLCSPLAYALKVLFGTFSEQKTDTPLDSNTQPDVDISDILSEKFNKIIEERREERRLQNKFFNDNSPLSLSDFDIDIPGNKEDYIPTYVLSAIGGCHIEITEKSKIDSDLLKKWIDKKTKALYIMEVYKNGKPTRYFMRRELWNATKEKIESIDEG